MGKLTDAVRAGAKAAAKEYRARRRQAAEAEATALPELPRVSRDLLDIYFTFQGYGSAVSLVVLLAAVFLGSTVTGASMPMLLASMALGSWASFRTVRLLRANKTEGALMAGGALGATLLTGWSAGHLGLGALLSGIGVALATHYFVALRRMSARQHPRPDEEL